MSYKGLGYQKWGVTNPWVFANYGQPQRGRGYVSPMVFQTSSPYLKSAHLGTDDITVMQAEMAKASEEKDRSERMEKIAIAGLTMSAVSLFLIWNRTKK